uniref:Autophagy-related protein n=1 Tax=Angiostrongylus cantonensis TaxID=6313 RepID=A0A0K0DEX5_ANGCA
MLWLTAHPSRVPERKTLEEQRRGCVVAHKIDEVGHSSGNLTTTMAGTADAADMFTVIVRGEIGNALGFVCKFLVYVFTYSAETTKGYASQAQQAIGKIIPSASHDHDQVGAGGSPPPPASNPNAPPQPPQ